MIELKGVISQQNIKGLITQQCLKAVMPQIITRPIAEYYTGAYEVVPKIREQVLETKEKILKENVTVKSIPYAEVTNIANGLTVTIGEPEEQSASQIKVADDGSGNIVVSGLEVSYDGISKLTINGASITDEDGAITVGGN